MVWHYRPVDHEAHDAGIARDIAIGRVAGAPMIACLLGVHLLPDTEGVTLACSPDRPAMARGPGLTGICTVVDLAMGGAIRRRIGRERTVQTITMGMQLAFEPTGPFHARAVESLEPRDAMGATRAQLISGGVVAGDFIATFNVPPAGAPAPVLPWEVEAGAAHPDLTLTPLEARIAASLQGFGRSPASGPWVEEELARACTREGDHLTLVPTIAMLNRLGNVQGGVLFGVAAQAAAVLVGPAMRLRSAHMDFLAAARADQPTRVEPEILRAGKSTAFLAVRVLQGGEPVAAASFTYRAQR